MKRAFSRKNLWDKTPAAGRAAIGSMLSIVPLPRLLGADFRRWHQLALEADRWDAEQIRAYQLAQLRRMLTLAHEKTAFYRESFQKVGFEPGDLKSAEDLQRLPTIDKTTVRENWERMLTRPITDPKVDLVSTGGTSGEPLTFYMSSSRHALEFAHLSACWSRVGYKPGDVMAVLRGRVIAQRTNGLYHQYDPLFRHHYYSTFHMSPDNLRGYVRHMHQAQPKYLHAYPSSLSALAKFILAEGLKMPSSIQAALLESEPVFSHQRDLIQDKLGLHVFSSYGQSEKVILAAECENSHDYHVVPTYGFCEIIDRQGLVVAPGQQGEMTGTGFIETVMPFIRYRTGDDVTSVEGKCPSCGRSHALLKNLQPRRGQEFLICRDGSTMISMSALNLHDDTLKGIIRFQFVQDEPGKASLKLVPTDGTVQLDLQRLYRHYAPKLGHGLDLEISIVPEIPLTRVGKQPLILQRCPGFDQLLKGTAN